MWERLWSFNTKRFTVELSCEPEQYPDVSWMDADDLAQLDSGELVNVTFRVRVLLDGREVGADYLSNSVYADVREFAQEHRTGTAEQRNTLANKARRVCICAYFPDMVREAVERARAEVKRMQDAHLREVA